MANFMIPAPGEAEPDRPGKEQTQGNDSGDGTRGHRQSRSARKPPIPSEEQCLQALTQLAGLVALGLLKPAQANTIRGTYRDILQHHKSKAKEAEKGLSNADVLGLLRKHPEILSLLEPLLTEEQIAMVMKEVGGGGDGET